MATMETLQFLCEAKGCNARATRRVRKQNGSVDADYCARHGNVRLVELAKEEGKAKT